MKRPEAYEYQPAAANTESEELELVDELDDSSECVGDAGRESGLARPVSGTVMGFSTPPHSTFRKVESLTGCWKAADTS